MFNWLKSLAFKKKNRDKRALKKSHNEYSDLPSDVGNTRYSNSDYAEHLSEATIIHRGEHGVSRKQIDTHALKVLYRLHKAGFQACLVGGAVRDLLIGVRPKDFDVATDATPEEVNALFRNCRLIGRRFRLAHVHFGRLIIEVATYRADHDGSSQSGVLDDTGKIVRDNVYGTIADDVWRRDFTANALYYDISNFSIIDFVGGWQDIQQGQLNMIGDAEVRYREDPVRMLRAVRFAAKLNFTIEEDSRLPIYRLGDLLDGIAPARLYEEALKLFHSGHAIKSFDALNEYDLLQYLFPATADAIEHDEQFRFLLELAMRNTDDRIKNDMRVTPAFLFAALLWQPVSKLAKEISNKGMPYSVAIQKAATKVMSQQVKSISIPKRFTSTMRDIWGLQTRFHYRKGKRAIAVLEHPKFRAAYDFLCLRAQSGEDVDEECEWWTEFQKQSPSDQKDTVNNSNSQNSASNKSSSGDGAPKKKRRRKPKKKLVKSDSENNEQP